jgi:hypothetical protein
MRGVFVLERVDLVDGVVRLRYAKLQLWRFGSV